MRTAIKLIFCLAIFFAFQAKELSAQVVNNTAGAFPAPDGLTLKGTAEVPMSLAKATERYNNYYQASPVEGWTVDNKIIVKEFGRTASLLTYRQPEVQPTPILTFPLPAYDIYPSDDRKNYLYNQDTDGKLNYRMFVWNHESKQSVALTDIGTRSVQPIWSPSGKYVAYSFSAPDTKGMEIAWQNPFKPEEKRIVFSSPYMVQAVAWSKDDRFVAVEEYVNLADMTRLWLIEPQTGKKTLLNKSEKDAFGIDDVQFSTDGKYIYLTSNSTGEFLSFERINLSTKEWTTIYKNEAADIEIARLSPDESKAAFVFNDRGVSRLVFYDLKTGKLESVSKLNPGAITNLEWSPDSKQVAFNLDYASEASSIYTVAADSSSLQITRWAHEPNKDADENLPLVERIEWQSKPDGKTIGGWMFKSKKSAAAPRAVIIEFHGGPSEESRPVLNYNDLYYLNDLDTVVIYPNVRGSRGAGKSFSLGDNGEFRANQLNDVAGLLDWIKKQPDLDANRVMLRGFSYGGYLALLAAARFPDKIAAVSAQAAPTNLATLQANDPAWRVGTSRTEFGDETNPQTKQALEKIAVPNMASNLKVPILLAHGELDTQVPASEARQLIAAVEKQSPNTPLWTVFGKPDKHGLGGVRSFYHSLLEIVFFEKYVLRRGETNK
ncbi:MAG: alpha/beta fold hydrolase [Pyrinomonadaceae bacterium]|nr:alpha/beta fold hydrolase [Pyrinomonadaceae bacterium]